MISRHLSLQPELTSGIPIFVNQLRVINTPHINSDCAMPSWRSLPGYLTLVVLASASLDEQLTLLEHRVQELDVKATKCGEVWDWGCINMPCESEDDCAGMFCCDPSKAAAFSEKYGETYPCAPDSTTPDSTYAKGCLAGHDPEVRSLILT